MDQATVPKPPEVAAVDEPPPKNEKTKAKVKLTLGGDTFRNIEEEIISLWENIGHHESRVVIVCNTMELGDYCDNPRKARELVQPCYRVKKPVKINKKDLAGKTEYGLDAALDRLALLNPKFVTVNQVSDLELSLIHISEPTRPY